MPWLFTTAKNALDAWDAGEEVPAFQVEAKPERQTMVYAAAFELIRNYKDLGTNLDLPELDGLSQREKMTAHSIAYVAMQNGWAKMVTQHVTFASPAMTIRKPEKAEVAG